MFMIIAQLFGWASTFCSAVTYIFKKRRSILFAKVSADLTSVIHYCMLGAFTGAVICGINVVRDTLYYNRDSKITKSIFCPLVFGVVTVISCALTWLGWVSILPTVGSCIGVVGLWMKKTLHIRLIMIPALTLWLIYGVLIGSVPTILSNVLALCFLFVGLARELSERKANK
ncbi:MAG: YgjV family protein [Clostridia bacterium]|nr:YgjV family protein [Clostridia bacterium]